LSVRQDSGVPCLTVQSIAVGIGIGAAIAFDFAWRVCRANSRLFMFDIRRAPFGADSD
jgi:hypothetical protein